MKWILVIWLLGVATAATANGVTALKVVDYAGRTVELNKPAKRAIALAPHIVENVFSAGAGEFLIGVVDYSDFPEQAKSIPRVGSLSSQSIENIVALKPDLVIAWAGSGGAKWVSQLAPFGIPVYVSDPRKLPDVARSIRDFGVLFGSSVEASKAAEDFDQTLSRLREDYSSLTPQLSVLYQVWHSPLQTINNAHIISDVISLCGGINAFGEAPTIAPKISIESVVARDPDLIVASGMGEARPDWLDDWKQWPSLSAVRLENLYFIPPDLIQRHTARLLEGAKQMCESLASARKKIELSVRSD